MALRLIVVLTRVAAVGLMGTGIAWSLGGMLLQRVMSSSMPQLPSRPTAEVVLGFETMARVTGIRMTLFAVGISGVMG